MEARKKYVSILACLALLGPTLFAQPTAARNSTPQGQGPIKATPGKTGGEQEGLPVGNTTAGLTATPGVITIQGTVNSEEEARQIEQHLKQISSVRSVVNLLRIRGENSQTEKSAAQGSRNEGTSSSIP